MIAECLDERRALEWVSRARRRPEIWAHLDRCPECRRLVAGLGRLSGPGVQEPQGAPPDGRLTAAGLPRSRALRARLGRFEIRGVIGAGALAIVVRGHDRALDRPVAIKVLRSIHAEDARAEHQLRAGARALARLSHPNLVTVYEISRLEGRLVLVMELIDGPDLWTWLRASRRSREQILEVFLGAGRALGAAHAAGLAHRDFKPQNVLVGSDGRARVTDFGAAGTPAYMAPEQHAGLAGDAASDQFSFAVALWEALFRRRPHRGTTPSEIYASIRAGTLSGGHRSGAAAEALQAVLRRALAPSPSARFADMAGLLCALEGAGA